MKVKEEPPGTIGNVRYMNPTDIGGSFPFWLYPSKLCWYASQESTFETHRAALDFDAGFVKGFVNGFVPAMIDVVIIIDE